MLRLFGLNSSSGQWVFATHLSLALHGALFAALLLGSSTVVRMLSPQQGETSIVLTMATMSSAIAEPTVRLEALPKDAKPIEGKEEPATTPSGNAPQPTKMKRQSLPGVPNGELDAAAEQHSQAQFERPKKLETLAPPKLPARRPKRKFAKRRPTTSSQVSLSSIAKPSGVKLPVPKITFMADVEYPAAALAARQTGNVTVTVTLASSGKVTSAQLYRTSGHELLDKAGVKAAKSWRFSKGDEGRKLRIVIPFQIVER